MDSKDVHYSAKGFLKDAAYTADLYQLLCNYKDKFGHAESLTLNLIETIPGLMEFDKVNLIDISDDGFSVVINIKCYKFIDSRGKVKSIPEPNSVYEDIHFAMNKAIKEYPEKLKD